MVDLMALEHPNPLKMTEGVFYNARNHQHIHLNSTSVPTAPAVTSCGPISSAARPMILYAGAEPCASVTRDDESQQFTSMSRDMLLSDFAPFSVTRTVSL
ncbi:hypothetical protein NKJ73_31735, partial [Mesorhizobium sp. M0074]|uniref:hypothetical protein n=1 Tax=Mesorhizobium sp. M0074 TaxID=2956869 RepID=UPI003336BBFE